LEKNDNFTVKYNIKLLAVTIISTAIKDLHGKSKRNAESADVYFNSERYKLHCLVAGINIPEELYKKVKEGETKIKKVHRRKRDYMKRRRRTK